MTVSRMQRTSATPVVLVSRSWIEKRDRPIPHIPFPGTPANRLTHIVVESKERDPAFDAVLASASSSLDLALAGNSILRSAIQQNLVSFPAEIPFFILRDDARRRIVQLYFLRGWSVRAIGNRYKLSRVRIHAVLRQWTFRAVAAGYIQDIRPDPPAMLTL
jgi:hypothetical protein